ncbi:MAG: ABC transporter permease [Anaerolineae bacterium]|nr:ABC transporter permease [Anaerolineae bacterium]NUQ04301.1 ABC transporter permease [Anaerolineae bacterium]
MNARVLGALLRKDLTLYFRNRFFAYITVVGLVVYVALYILLPSTVDESLTLGVYAPTLPDAFIGFLGNNDITIDPQESDEALQQAVADSKYAAGVVLTGEVISGIMRGDETTVTVYFASDAPQEIVDALRTVLRLAFNALSYTLGGDPLRLEFSEQIIGPDMTGQQLALRDRLLPLMAIMVLVMEVMGLGSLIADEVETGTLRALLITPVTVPGLFTGKAIFGLLQAFIQSALLLGLTGGLTTEPLLVLITLLLSALVVVGLAFLIASASRGMMGVMAWSVLVIILMMIPSYGVVFPGVASNWAQILPSYYMLDTLHQVVNFGASWNAVGGNLVILLVVGVALMTAGAMVMERKVR